MKFLFKVLFAVMAIALAVTVSSFRKTPLDKTHLALQHYNTLADSSNTRTYKDSITWYSFDVGYALAQKQNKILLVDVYTNWCGWCKVMDRETYTNPEVINKINASFVAVKLNPEISRAYDFSDTSMDAAELHRWLGYGKTFGYPTTYFVISRDTYIDRYALEGYRESPEFLKILDIVISKKGQ